MSVSAISSHDKQGNAFLADELHQTSNDSAISWLIRLSKIEVLLNLVLAVPVVDRLSFRLSTSYSGSALGVIARNYIA